MAESIVREKSDDEQSDDENHDQPVNEDEYHVGNDTDSGELVQPELCAGNVEDDMQPDDEYQPVRKDEEDRVVNDTNTNDPEAAVEDDSEIEFWESYEELKEEPFEMEPLRRQQRLCSNR